MDKQPLTPHKIQKLIHLAEDKSFRQRDEMAKRVLIHNEENVKRLIAERTASMNNNISPNNRESSSGILDLEHIKGFDESGIEDICLNRSSAFIPGEMTGRSTGTEDINSETVGLGHASYGSQLLNVDNLTSEADKQTNEITNILRNSITSSYSFRSNVNLTEEEASLIRREAPLPVPLNAMTNLGESVIMDVSAKSVGSYFQSRCPDLKNVLGTTDSPNKSMAPSITEVSIGPSSMVSTNQCKHDQSLDCVPVKQPRNLPSSDKVLEKLPIAKVNPSKISNSQNCLLDKTVQFSNAGLIEKKTNITNKEADIQKYVAMATTTKLNTTMGPPSAANKSFIMSHKPSDILHRNVLHLKAIPEDDSSVDNSMSISKIADFLGKQSNVSITDMLQYNQRKPTNKKEPLAELQLNTLENKETKDQTCVSYLIDTKQTEMARTTDSVETVILIDKLKITQNVPDPNIVITIPSFDDDDVENGGKESVKTDGKRTKSKSPSSKSTSTYSTVQENCSSFRCKDDSPLQTSKGEANTSYVPSPNIEYRELDKSVDWHEILQQKFSKQDCLVQGQWAEVDAVSLDGFVGVRHTVNINVKTVINNWLTAKIEFDNSITARKDISIELPRLPLLLSPRRTEQFALHITCNEEINQNFTFTMHLKDTAIEREMTQKSTLQVNIKMPPIQVLSNDGIDKIAFPVTQEKSSIIKSLAILNECPGDLQLDLSIVEGESIFSIKNVQEIAKSDVDKVISNRAICVPNGGHSVRGKNKGMNKQLCRLRSGHAISFFVMFDAPKLSELQLTDSIVTFTGALNVAMIGVSGVLRKVTLAGTVGSANLVVDVPETGLRLGSEGTTITLRNTGSAAGSWTVKYTYSNNDRHFPFKMHPSKFEIHPGSSKDMKLTYTGPQDVVDDATLTFEDLITGNKTTIEISGGMEKPKVFPIKTNFNNMSWVQAGRKELSLKNSTDSKVHIICRIVGQGFSIDHPCGESGMLSCSFEPQECIPLRIVFQPNSSMPHAATLHLVFDKTSDSSRKVSLFGSASSVPVRWSGHVTYHDTAAALVRAVYRAPIELTLYNRSQTPAFIYARVHFNLQYISVAAGARLSGDRHIVGGKSKHKMTLSVEWSRVEKRLRNVVAPPPLATVTVLAGSEFTRRRILKVIRNESNGEFDTSLLPDNLKVLAEKFEGEDVTMDNQLVHFKETKSCLDELIAGLQELTAQVCLPQDLSEESTIVVLDDTVLEHHTLYD